MTLEPEYIRLKRIINRPKLRDIHALKPINDNDPDRYEAWRAWCHAEALCEIAYDMVLIAQEMFNSAHDKSMARWGEYSK